MSPQQDLRSIGLNQMTMPKASTRALIQLAREVGCAVELRNDLPLALFDGQAPADFQNLFPETQILSLAEVYGFNDGTDQTFERVQALAATASATGAAAFP